jgi:hypothetical protein
MNNRQEVIDYVFLNLKIISQLKDGQKLRVRKINDLDILDIDNRYIYKYFRGAYGDNRDNTMNVIKHIIDLAYNISDEILYEETEEAKNQHKTKKSPFDSDDDNTILFRKLVAEMENSLEGLNKLKTTYEDDISISSMLDLLMNKITTRITKINGLFKISRK